MKIGTKPVYISDDGAEFATMEEACQRSALEAFFKITDLSTTDHRGAAALRTLAEKWDRVHTEMLRINRERVDLENEWDCR